MNQQIVIRYSNRSDANTLWELIRDHARYEGHNLTVNSEGTYEYQHFRFYR